MIFKLSEQQLKSDWTSPIDDKKPNNDWIRKYFLGLRADKLKKIKYRIKTKTNKNFVPKR